MKKYIALFLILLSLTGCTSTSINKNDIMQDDQIVKYISTHMEQKYEKDFDVEIIKKEELVYRDSFSFMGVPTGQRIYNVKGGNAYIFRVVDSDNIVSDVYYAPHIM